MGQYAKLWVPLHSKCAILQIIKCQSNISNALQYEDKQVLISICKKISVIFF